MIWLHFLLSSLLISRTQCDGTAKVWFYSAQHKWKDSCKGSQQSPIDIETKSVSVNKTMDIKRRDYDLSYKDFKVINNGYTSEAFNANTLSQLCTYHLIVQVTLNAKEHDGKLPTITGSAINGVYVFEQLHFHWSHKKNRGAEHSIDDKHYPVEMHLVHYNKKYKNIGNALKHPDGLVVMAIYFDREADDNKQLNVLVKRIVDVLEEGEVLNVKQRSGKLSLELNDLLPKELKRFYKYQGSLTTPPCAESVIWIVFDTPNMIGESQYKKSFKSLSGKEGKLTDTFRKKQNLNDRKVETNEDLEGQE